MFSKTLLVSTLTATALALAAPEPVITAAPAVRARGVGDTLGEFGSNVDDIIGGASSLLGGAGSNIGDVISNVGGDVGGVLSNIGTNLGDLGTCVSIALEIATEVPTPPKEIASAIGSALATASPTDNCFASVIPTSLSQEYQAYESSLASWYAANSNKISSLVEACPTLPDEQKSSLASVTPCATALGANSSGNGNGSGSGNGNGSGSGGSAASSIRVTGAVAGVAAAAIGAAAFFL